MILSVAMLFLAIGVGGLVLKLNKLHDVILDKMILDEECLSRRITRMLEVNLISLTQDMKMSMDEKHAFLAKIIKEHNKSILNNPEKAIDPKKEELRIRQAQQRKKWWAEKRARENGSIPEPEIVTPLPIIQSV